MPDFFLANLRRNGMMQQTKRVNIFCRRSPIFNRSILLLLGLWCLTLDWAARGQTLNLPPRPAGAPNGTQAISTMTPMTRTQRENWISQQVLSGNVPEFLRALVPVTVSATVGGTNLSCTYYVIPDYLALGNDSDYFLTPMTPLLGQRLADALGCILPTRKMVNQIWTNAAVKMNPQPIPPSGAMTTVPVFADHNFMVRTQRNLTTNSFPLGALVSGDKKDVIISSKIYTNFSGPLKPVVIYGWHSTSGSPIQPLYNGHEEAYADYSHGIRLVQNAIMLNGSATTVSNVLISASTAALLSDEGSGEGTSAGVIRIPRYTVGPTILTHPRSQTVLPGATVAFQGAGQSEYSLTYQWLRNNAPLNGVTNSIFTLSNVQPADIGNYSLVISDGANASTSRVARLWVNTNPLPVLFMDNFEIPSSTNWNLFWGATNNVPDYTVNWSYAYTAVSYSFAGVTHLIPPAPTSPDGTARGVKFTVNNNDAVPCIAGVNIYPKTFSVSSNFSLKFDMFINYPGPAGGSAGSTEHAIFGINHTGTRVNWAAPAAAASDGLWFGVDGEGGDTRDYRAYAGNPSGAPVDLTSGLTASNNSAPFYQALFAPSQFETAGAPGKNWVEVELRQTNNFVFWLLDRTIVAQRTNNTAFREGNIMLGFMDTFNSIASPVSDAFVLFDNVRVEDLSGRPRILSIHYENNAMALTISGVPGRNCALEASTNLVQWTEIGNRPCTNSPMLWIDAEAQNASRFYRARL